MVEDKFRINSLELALKNEINEHNFYLEHASRTTNLLGKSMFMQIANDELEHYERLTELHKILTAKGKWPSTLPLKVKNTNIQDIFQDIILTTKEIKSISHVDIDDVKALRTAIEFESKGVSFYKKLENDCFEIQEKEFFKLLSDIENEHYLSLINAEEFFKDPEGWYRRYEKHSFEG